MEIEVTQADRDEAEKHWLWLLDDERDELAQAFARHRQAAFAEGFSAALQGAEAAIWRIEDDSFLYENVSKALQEVISELQAMEQNWTGRVTIEHRQAAIKQRDAQLEEQQGVIKRLLTANRVLRQGLHGLVDSEDASEIATLLTTGQSVDWDAYPEATRRAIERGEV